MSNLETIVSGPCVAWVTVDQVAECCNADVGTETALFEDAALAASEVLYWLTGGMYTGTCEVEGARPCATGCSCWGEIVSPAQSPAYAVDQAQWSWGFWGWGWGWGWEGCSGELCSCGSLSRALLDGYPVVGITEVKIDGVVIDPSGYRLDQNRWLVRLADADGNVQFWPGCQRLDLDDDQPGTWSVSYSYGIAPPAVGEMAAAQLACEIYKACANQTCLLPAGVTEVTRQGITIRRAPFVTWAFVNGGWQSGLPLVDMFLQGVNPTGLIRRPSVWSPDMPPYPYHPGA